MPSTVCNPEAIARQNRIPDRQTNKQAPLLSHSRQWTPTSTFNYTLPSAERSDRSVRKGPREGEGMGEGWGWGGGQ